MSEEGAFAVLRGVRRIWAVGSVHGEIDALRSLHARLFDRLRPRDALVYLGNYLGYGSGILDTVSELLRFRRIFLARPPFVEASDFVLLRGSQEEMWQRVLQLQFAVNPAEVMEWMAKRGVAATLAAYAGGTQQEILGRGAGPLTIAQWTNSVRAAMREVPGHVEFMSALKRAAYTEGEGSMLFVNTGVDVSRPVQAQSDSFWWAGRSFASISEPYGTFTRIVRGYDPAHEGFRDSGVTVTVDGGCGFGGPLVAACFDAGGAVLERLEA